MTKKIVAKKKKLVVAKKKVATAPVKRVVVKAKKKPVATRLTHSAEPEPSKPVASEPVVVEEAAAPVVELVKCRFCDTMIPKPSDSTVYECDEHKNLTGDAKFNSLGQRTMV